MRYMKMFSLVVLAVGTFILFSSANAEECKSVFCKRFKRDSSDVDEGVTENDRKTCADLRSEYLRSCSKGTRSGEDDFCRAYENICRRIPLDEFTSTTRKPRIDFEQFCNQFKSRYLFVCPDPFRFGQKAVVFCPIYSDRCRVPLPDKPVVPTPKTRIANPMESVCRSYERFFASYCQNPVFLSQGQYREACQRFMRYCVRG